MIPQRLARLAARLRGRTVAELRERSAQRLAVLAERAGWRDDGEMSDRALAGRLVPSLAGAAPAEWGGALRRTPRPPGIPGLADVAATAEVVRTRWPDRVAEIARAADEIVAGRFQLLGHRPIPYPDPVAWNHDPILRVTAPATHWSRIAYLDPAVAGDHKLVWELNRHQFLVTLGQAWALTGRDVYAERAVALLQDWLDANPPKRGINWASSLEVAYRAIAWLWALRLLSGAPALRDDVLVRWLKAMEVSARHLERYLSTYFSPNTHLTGEALGLLYLGTYLPELAQSPRWRERGWTVLQAQLPRHVRKDGTYYEQATYYHRYTLDIYLHATLLGRAQGLAGTEAMMEAVVRLADHLSWIARGDGTIPLFGDEDGGRLLFLDGRPGDDVRAPLACVAAMVDDAGLAWSGGGSGGGSWGDEVAWLLGRAGVERLTRLAPRPPTECSRAFSDGGLFVMRDGWDRTASVFTIDCGPLGADNGGHAHADTLAFDLSIGGAPIFVDAGTVSYTTSPAERDLMRSSLVHNTVSLDGRSSSTPAGPFRWAHMSAGVLDTWVVTPLVTLFEGHHDGYAGLPSPARHRRFVLAARDGWWLVRDVVECEDEAGHDAVATFQCAPGLDVRLTDEGGTLRVSDDGRLVVRVVALGVTGRWVLDAGIASRRYGARDLGRRARFHFRAAGRTAVTFVLSRADAPALEVSREASAEGDVVRLAHGDVEDLVRFGAGDVVHGVRTDARVAWMRRRASVGGVESLLTVGGTRVELDGARLAEPDGGVLSATRAPDGWRVAHGHGRLEAPGDPRP